jgi:hypothetical protein
MRQLCLIFCIVSVIFAPRGERKALVDAGGLLGSLSTLNNYATARWLSWFVLRLELFVLLDWMEGWSWDGRELEDRAFANGDEGWIVVPNDRPEIERGGL